MRCGRRTWAAGKLGDRPSVTYLVHDLHGVGAEPGSRAGDMAGSSREPGRHARKAHRAVRSVDRLEESGFVQMRIVEQLVERAYRRGGDVKGPEQAEPVP